MANAYDDYVYLMSLSGNNLTLAIGNPGDNETGAVYVFAGRGGQ